jgi:ABC-type sugar transport system substrate-binding protein
VKTRWLALVVLVAACSKNPVVDPSSPDFAQGSHAQDEFQPLRAKWEHGDRDARIALEPALIRHVKVHAKDPTARTATAMLALVALANGDKTRAKDLAKPLTNGPPGVTRDMALVAYGAALREEGDAAAALTILSPLFGKVLDPFARDLMNEEVSIAAVDAGDYKGAVRYVRGWLAEADPDDKDGIKRRIIALLDRLPADPLVDLVRSVKGTDEFTGDLLHIVGERLAGLAISTKDVALAKLLMAEARPILGEREDDVARIAARGASVRLEHNTVGLLLSLRGEELQRRGLEVSNGLALALGLPGSAARVVSRDDQGDLQKVDDALALLNTDGAAVIIAGVDTAEASAAAAYAEKTGVPVILLRPPAKPPAPGGPVFVLGDDPTAVRGLLVSSLGERGKSRVAILAGARDDGDVPRSAGGADVVGVSPCGSSLEFVSVQKASGLVIDGGPTCIRDAIGNASGALVALGLDAPGDLGGKLGAHAGMFPFTATSPGSDAELAKFFALGRGAPSWWAGLGHDAGKLAWAAVSQLSEIAPTDADATSARKNQVMKLLSSAEGSLWTTEARGFAGGRVIPRSISVR